MKTRTSERADNTKDVVYALLSALQEIMQLTKQSSKGVLRLSPDYGDYEKLVVEDIYSKFFLYQVLVLYQLK